MDVIWDKIRLGAEENHGYITTSQVQALDISRPMIRKYVDAGYLQCARKGIYFLADELVDEYAMLQVQSSKAVYSYGTALFLWGMSDRIPHFYDLSFPQGANTSVLRRNNPEIRCHYVREDIFPLGITYTSSPQGAKVKLYDRERCICDLIRHRDQVELQLFTQAMNKFFDSRPNLRDLMKYSRLMGIEDKVRVYTEVML